MIGDKVVLKHDELFVVCDSFGDINAWDQLGAGFYFRDMRHVSWLHLEVDGCPLELVDLGTDAIDHLVVFLTNPTVVGGVGAGGESALPHTISLVRRRELHGDLTESLTIVNYNRFDITLRVRLTVAADFRDMFEVRGLHLIQDHGLAQPREEPEGICLVYDSADGTQFGTLVNCWPSPSELAIDRCAPPDPPAPSTVLPGLDRVVDAPTAEPTPALVFVHELALKAGADSTVKFTLVPYIIERDGRHERPVEVHGRVVAERFGAWRSQVTRLTTNNAAFNAILQRSLTDLGTLLTPFPGGTVIAAGIPWYVSPFGRDSIIAARQLLPFNPVVAAGTLRFLASVQGRTSDPWRDEAPGKIVHEIRYGEVARRNVMPHSRYYGTVDATPLFVWLMADYLDWTQDDALFDELRHNIDSALQWIDRAGDANGDGFIDYTPHPDRGLTNQGWKDSDTSLQRPDGSPIVGPIALVEAQGYVYAAKRGIARHLERRGDHEAARRLRSEADALRVAIERAYWSRELNYYVEALDGNGRPCDAISSNPGHLLACGVPNEHHASQVVDRLLAPDMFSGWGVRTLSSEMPHYNPISYHCGSVWPHDNGFLLWGFRSYRRFDALDRLATALVEAAARFPHYRLPELMCGFARGQGPHDVPISYPVSCSPQAWAAGTPFVIVESLLGLRADAARRELTLDPWLPPWLESIVLEGIQVGDWPITLDITGNGDQVAIQVRDNPGHIAVRISPE